MPKTTMIGTALTHPPLVPEVKLHLIPPDTTLESFRSEHQDIYGIATPYWAVAWPGGQALSRFIIDNPEYVRNHSVLDIGAGSGLTAIAAMKAGAATAQALDRDPHAVEATHLNACNNEVLCVATEGDLDYASELPADVILAGDLWYERFDARRATSLLRRLAGLGKQVLIGDLERAYFPRRGIEALASYTLPASTEMERTKSTRAGVWRLLPHVEDA